MNIRESSSSSQEIYQEPILEHSQIRNRFKDQINQKAGAIFQEINRTPFQEVKLLALSFTETITCTEPRNLHNFQNSIDQLTIFLDKSVKELKLTFQGETIDDSLIEKAKVFSEIAPQLPNLLGFVKLRKKVLKNEIKKINTNALFFKQAIGYQGNFLYSSSGSFKHLESVKSNSPDKKSVRFAPIELPERSDLEFIQQAAHHVKKEALESQGILSQAIEMGPHSPELASRLNKTHTVLLRGQLIDKPIEEEFARTLILLAQEILTARKLLDRNIQELGIQLTKLRTSDESDFCITEEIRESLHLLQSTAELHAQSELNIALQPFRNSHEEETALKEQAQLLLIKQGEVRNLTSRQAKHTLSIESHLQHLIEELSRLKTHYKKMEILVSSFDKEVFTLTKKLNANSALN